MSCSRGKIGHQYNLGTIGGGGVGVALYDIDSFLTSIMITRGYFMQRELYSGAERQVKLSEVFINPRVYYEAKNTVLFTPYFTGLPY